MLHIARHCKHNNNVNNDSNATTATTAITTTTTNSKNNSWQQHSWLVEAYRPKIVKYPMSAPFLGTDPAIWRTWSMPLPSLWRMGDFFARQISFDGDIQVLGDQTAEKKATAWQGLIEPVWKQSGSLQKTAQILVFLCGNHVKIAQLPCNSQFQYGISIGS